MEQGNKALERAAANKKLAYRLLWVVAGSLLFAFALVPLYNVLCSITGLNGKTQSQAATMAAAKVDNTRQVKVQFVATVMPGLGWNFYPKVPSVTLHPGQIESVVFVVKNTTSQTVAGQAVPSVTPGKASAHLNKIECFCFVRQELKAGETREMPLRFFVSPELPKDVHEMTLSYSFFSAVEK